MRAPGSVPSLSDYALQPPDGGPPSGNDEGEIRDTTRIFEPDIPVPEFGPAGGSPPAQQDQLPGFGVPDTTARLDSLLAIPGMQPAPVETIGPQSGALAGEPPAKPVKSKRGVFGLHPAALIAAMVVMHIFVVGLVTR